MSGPHVCLSPEPAGLECATWGTYARLPRAGTRGPESPSAPSHPPASLRQGGRDGDTEKQDGVREAETETHRERPRESMPHMHGETRGKRARE